MKESLNKNINVFAIFILTQIFVLGCGKKSNPNPTTPITPVNTLNYTVSTFSGNGSQGSSTGDAISSSYFYPYDLTTDVSGDLYIADFNNNQVRKITPGGVSSVFAGDGGLLTKEGTGINAGIFHPVAITIDSKSNLYVADLVGHILKITPAGVLSFFAGSGVGAADGLGTAASFNGASGLTVDASDNIYVADDNNYEIRKVTSAGLVSTFAGSSAHQGSVDGLGTAASFSNPVSITIDKLGNLYVSDVGDNRIRKITPAGAVTTIAGSGAKGFLNGNALQASFNYPAGLVVDANENIYVCDKTNNAIREITAAGVVSTFSGVEGFPGSTDGLIAKASFYEPRGIIINSKGEFYIADTFNNLIRKIVKE